MEQILYELSRYFFLGYFLLAWLVWKAPYFSGQGWFVLGFTLEGIPGLLWLVAMDFMRGSGNLVGRILWPLGLLALVVGALIWKRSGKGGEIGAVDPDSDQASFMIPRNDSNSISKAEKVRDVIYEYFVTACRSELLNAEIIKSPMYSSKIWVKVELYVPVNGSQDLALRSSAVVTVEPREFHRFEHEMTIVLNDSRKTRTYRSVIELKPAEALSICRYLAGRSRKPILKPRRCRSNPVQLWRPANKLYRIKRAHNVPAYLAAGGMLFSWFPPAMLLALILAGAVWLVQRNGRNRVLSLTSGKPRQEPRILLRMDSWQTVLYDIAPHATALMHQVREELRAEAAPAVPARPGRAATDRMHVDEEDIWYEGIDGKVERKQIVVRLGRAICFIHVYTYGDDLYVGWDAHINGGTWIEKLLGEGIERRSKKLARAYGIRATWHTPNEYDVTDANFLLEWVHSVVVRLVKQTMRDHEIDQEIDFSIVREPRQGLAGSKNPEEETTKRSRFRRVA